MKKAIVLLNMGGPNNLDEVGVFLKNMFNDENIITVKSDLLRSFIAFMITTLRTKEARGNYERIGGKSPLVGLTKTLVEKLESRFDEDTRVFFAMRYTPPFADECIASIEKEQIEELYLIPLYPQYSTTTTKSSLEDFVKRAKNSSIKSIYAIDDFYENVLYNEAVIEKIKERSNDIDTKEYELIFSAHSLPQKIIDGGDPYQKQIIANVDILKQMLKDQNIEFKNISIAYQSKLGPVKWLEPALGDVLKSKKNQKVIIYPLSFIIDNSETLFELCIEYKEEVEEFGLSDYKVCECVNSSGKFIEALVDIYKNREFYKLS